MEEINTTKSKREEGRVARLEEQVRMLQTKPKTSTGHCQTCTRPTHAKGECLGKKLKCFDCGKTGHFQGSVACQKKKVKPKKKDKARKVDKEMERAAADSDTGSSVGRVKEVVRADQASKSKIAHLQMTVLSEGKKSPAQ